MITDHDEYVSTIVNKQPSIKKINEKTKVI